MSRLGRCGELFEAKRKLGDDISHCQVNQSERRIEAQDVSGKRFDALQGGVGRIYQYPVLYIAIRAKFTIFTSRMLKTVLVWRYSSM